jgi:hypothetical protein
MIQMTPSMSCGASTKQRQSSRCPARWPVTARRPGRPARSRSSRVRNLDIFDRLDRWSALGLLQLCPEPIHPHHLQERRTHRRRSSRWRHPPEPQAHGSFAAARTRLLRAPVLWGVVFGGIQAAAPLGFWWLDPATVYALSLALIAAVYIGFAVADGRPAVLAVESGVAGAFVVLAAMGVTGPAWLLVLGFTGHGLKDLWRERRHYVANTRWWPPFCLVIDWVAAAILVVLITAGVDFHH